MNLVCEDDLSEFVLKRLLNCFEGKFDVGYSYSRGGYSYIKSNINGFNQACISTPFFVLTDLDNCPCPGELVTSWLKRPMHENMIFRVAVREVESWLLADIDGLSDFIGVSKANFRRDPENLTDPKGNLINLTRRSRRRDIREDIVPINEHASIGPNYNGRLMQFVFNKWDINRAMTRSQSLRKAYQRLKTFEYHI